MANSDPNDSLNEASLQPLLRRGGLKNWAFFFFVRFKDQPSSKSRRKKTGQPDSTTLKDDTMQGEASRDAATAHRRAAFMKFAEKLEKAAAKPEKRTSDSAEETVSASLLETSTLAFTFTGLRDLGVHPDTLDSFPPAYKDGMAARASLLGDVGPNGPEHWDGRLGSRDTHAVLIVPGHQLSETVPQFQTEHFRSRMRALASTYEAWQSEILLAALKKEAKAVTSKPDASALSALIAAFTDIDIMDFEFGEDPYRQTPDDEQIELITPRVEHFGYRDGLSQPYFLTDGKPKAPTPGGGRPYADGSWAPVATGELLLGHADEDGAKTRFPSNESLRQDGSYLVLRKLEQDVHGFQDYLDENTGGGAASEKLAAQMMGRWRNGAPIVDYPETPDGYDGADWSSLNDFGYGADPHGLVCPIGAHVRRLNPRDMHAGEAARRHRMLRRSISYGGALIDSAKKTDSTPRGMLFMALVSRIDLQFELVQRDWLNSGELFGQVGAGKCPISGNNTQQHGDSFISGSSPAARTHIPRFVTLRGGDYFFVPSRRAMKELLKSLKTKTKDVLFPPQVESSKTPVSAVQTPQLLTEARLERYGREILAGAHAPKPPKPPKPSLYAPSIKRVRIQDDTAQAGTAATKHMVFVGRYQDVVHIQNTSTVFTERHYKQIGLDLSGDRVIIGEPADSPLRAERLRILHSAYYTLGCKYRHAPVDKRVFKAIRSKDIAQLTTGQRKAFRDSVQAVTDKMQDTIHGALRNILARVGPAGRMDLLQDMGFAVPYAIASRIFGIPGPAHLTPIAVATRFAKAEITEIPASWLRDRQDIPPAAIPYITLQTWTRFAFAEVFTNIVRASELTRISRKAYDEFARHLENLMRESERAAPGIPTLLSELVANQKWTVQDGKAVTTTDSDIIRENLKQSRLAVTDIMGALMVNIGPPFGKMMELLFRQPSSVRAFIDQHCASGPTKPPSDRSKLNAFIDECLRFEPAASVQFRTVKTEDSTYELPSGALVADGDLIALIIRAANRDKEFDPDENLPVDVFSTNRDPNVYIGFGGRPGVGGEPSPALHFCWGEQIGRLCLREMLVACWGLEDLRRATGPSGEMEKSLGLPYSLQVRFKPSGG